jgi:hypothetical protein
MHGIPEKASEGRIERWKRLAKRVRVYPSQTGAATKGRPFSDL